MLLSEIWLFENSISISAQKKGDVIQQNYGNMGTN